MSITSMIVPVIDHGPLIESIFIGVLCSVVCFLLCRKAILQQTQGFGRPTLPLLTAAYLLALTLTACYYYYLRSFDLEDRVAKTVFAYFIGILCAFLCQNLKTVVGLVSTLAAAQAIYTVFYQIHGVNVFVSGQVLRAGGTFNHPNGVYTVMLLSLPLAVSGILTHKEGWQTFFMVCSSVILCALILTWYRGGILGVSVALALLAMHVVSSRHAKLFVVSGLAVIVLLVFLHRSSGSVNAISAQRSIAGRYALMQQGLVVFQKYWLTGVGIGALDIPTKLNTRQFHVTRYTVSRDPKNFVLYWICEMGVGGAALLILFTLLIRANINQSPSSWAALGLSSCWLALLVAGMFDTPFGTPERYYGNALVGCLIGATIILPLSKVYGISDLELSESCRVTVN